MILTAQRPATRRSVLMSGRANQITNSGHRSYWPLPLRRLASSWGAVIASFRVMPRRGTSLKGDGASQAMSPSVTRLAGNLRSKAGCRAARPCNPIKATQMKSRRPNYSRKSRSRSFGAQLTQCQVSRFQVFSRTLMFGSKPSSLAFVPSISAYCSCGRKGRSSRRTA
jgi:hypothetical protein